jgi:hypothetical protein
MTRNLFNKPFLVASGFTSKILHGKPAVLAHIKLSIVSLLEKPHHASTLFFLGMFFCGVSASASSSIQGTA